MALVYIRADDEDGYSSSTADTDVFVKAGVMVGSVQLYSTHHDVIVQGAVMGGTYGLDIGPSTITADGQSTLSVAAGGLVAGRTAVHFVGVGHQLTNAGDIMGQDIGVEMIGSGGSSLIQNQGLISADGIAIASAGTQMVTLRNNGTVAGGETAYQGGEGADRIVNRGVMEGSINPGDGSDRFDNRGGRIEDVVHGGAGNDLFTPGADDELLYGDDGFDTLDFRQGGAVRASLRDTNGTGAAQGDLYDGFEQLWGSFSGSDTLIGAGEAETIWGFGGNDILTGGGKRDELYGGDGDDRFRFDSISERGDYIEDWGSVTDNNDLFVIRAAGFGGGLAAGKLGSSLFRSRADNVAQDTNDRFIFRTTDRTLWFDPDGSSEKAALLVADLQAGAVVSYTDILLF